MKNWPTIVVIVILLTALYMGWQWIWGVFFLFWTFEGIRNNESYIVQPIRRDEDPIVYWVLIATWFLLSIYSFSVLWM